MRNINVRLFGVIALSSILGHSASSGAVDSDNWPQWRGPLASGVAPAGNPPVSWSETDHVRWKVKIPGNGNGTPIIWGKQVFVQTAISTGMKPADAQKSNAERTTSADNAGSGPRGGPMKSEKPDQIYQFVLLCLDRDTGKV